MGLNRRNSSGAQRRQRWPDVAWTARQLQVLHMLERGKTNPEIGQALGVSLDGAKWHVSEVMTKLGVHSREEAAAYWREHESMRARLGRGTSVFGGWGLARFGAAALASVVVSGVVISMLIARQSSPIPGAGDLTSTGEQPTADVASPVVIPATATLTGAATGTEERIPPKYNRFIRPDNGRFETLLWDDRPISDEAKAAQPWYDPRWTKFNQCLVAEGYDIRPDPTQPFSQRDLDALLARINSERPDGEANRQIGADIDAVPGIAGAFLRCAHWIAYSREQWAANGIVDLQPGEIPPP